MVDSSAALAHFASQLHVLTSPLPSAQVHAQLSSLENGVAGQLDRLDELSALLEALKHGASQAGAEVMPQLLQRHQENLVPLFERVHLWASYAGALEAQLAGVEKRVASVERGVRATAALEADVARLGGATTAAQEDATKAERKGFFSSFLSLSNSGPGGANASAASASLDAQLDALDTWVPFDESKEGGLLLAHPDIDAWFSEEHVKQLKAQMKTKPQQQAATATAKP
jgi:hypothetical protein